MVKQFLKPCLAGWSNHEMSSSSPRSYGAVMLMVILSSQPLRRVYGITIFVFTNQAYWLKARIINFVVSKSWCLSYDVPPDDQLIYAMHACRNLQLEYLDLYLIHWPVSSRSGTYEFPINKGDLLPMDFKSVWEAMQECQDLGLTKSIGVSNFSCKKLSDILAFAKIPPAVNQVSLLCDFWLYH